MTRKQIFNKVYRAFIKEFVFNVSERITKSSDAKALKERLFTLLQKVAKDYGRADLNKFENEEELLKEVTFQTIVIYTFFLMLIPDLLVQKDLTYIDSMKEKLLQ